MGVTDQTRWTIVVTERPGRTTTMYGLFTNREQAKAKAQQWQNVFNKRYAPGEAPVVSLAPVYPANTGFRDLHWT